MRTTYFLVWLAVAVLVGAVVVVVIDTYSTTGARAQLADIRQSFESARADSERLTESFRGITDSIGVIVATGNSISNANTRSLFLIGALRSLVDELRKNSPTD